MSSFEPFLQLSVVVEIEELTEKIEIQPTQTISELLEIYGGSTTSPEDIFNPKRKKVPKQKKKPQPSQEIEEPVDYHQGLHHKYR